MSKSYGGDGSAGANKEIMKIRFPKSPFDTLENYSFAPFNVDVIPSLL